MADSPDFDPLAGTIFGGATPPPAPAAPAPSPWGWVPDAWSGIPTPQEAPSPLVGPPTSADQIPPPAPAAPPVAPPVPYGAGYEPPPPVGPPATPQKVSDVAEVHTETPYEKYSADPDADPNVEERGRIVQQMAVTDPLAFDRYQIKHDQARIASESEQRANIEAQNIADAHANLAKYQQAAQVAQQKSDAIVADAFRLANTKENPNRWFQNLGTVGKVGVGVNLIVGGLLHGGNGFQGSGTATNEGADWVKGQIDRDVDAQRQDIANGFKSINIRENAVAQEFARTGDLFHATESVRLGAYQSAINKLQAEMQNYDPASTTVMRLGQAAQRFVATQQAAAEATRKTAFDEHLKLLDAQEKMATALETKRHNQAQEGIDWARYGLERDKAGVDNELLGPVAIKQLYPNLPDAAIPQGGMTRKQLATHIETYNKSLETAGKTVENQGKVTDSTVRNPITGKAIPGPDGNPVIKTPEKAEELNEQTGSAQMLLNKLGAARRMLEADPSLIDREEWQGLSTDLADAKVKYIEFHKTKASSREMEGMSEVMGPDFQHLSDRVINRKNAMRAIDELTKAVKSDTAVTLKTKTGYDGPIDSILVDTSKPYQPRPPSPDDRAYGAAMTVTDAGIGKAIADPFGDVGSKAGITDAARYIRKLGALSAGGDQTSTDMLRKLADSAASGDVRDIAQNMITQTSMAPGSPEELGVSTRSE